MARNVLQIARSVGAVVGIRNFSSLINNPEPHVAAILNLMNYGCDILAQMRGTSNQGWVVLNREYTFDTRPGVEEYAFPEDYQELIDGTLWDRDTFREMRGPLSPTEWQRIKSGLVETTSIAPNFRLRRDTAGTGKAFFVDPVPGGVETLVIEYVSDYWCVSADGNTFRREIAADTDQTLFDDTLVYLNTLWRFKQSRGLSFAPELAEFEVERDRRFAKDAGMRTIYLGKKRQPLFRGQIPESGFGGVSTFGG